MRIVRVETLILAPPERCFDLARDMDVHVGSAKATSEKIVGGLPNGLLGLGEVVEFEAMHFGFRQRLTARITAFNRPVHFKDEQVHGIFRSFEHDHFFETLPGGTLMKDVFRFVCPLGVLGKIAEPIVGFHLRKFLTVRGLEIKRVAEEKY